MTPWTVAARLLYSAGGKEPPASAGDTRDAGSILRREDALEEGVAAHSSILAWRIPRTEEPGGLQPTGSQRGRHDWAHMHSPAGGRDYKNVLNTLLLPHLFLFVSTLEGPAALFPVLRALFQGRTHPLYCHYLDTYSMPSTVQNDEGDVFSGGKLLCDPGWIRA